MSNVRGEERYDIYRTWSNMHSHTLGEAAGESSCPKVLRLIMQRTQRHWDGMSHAIGRSQVYRSCINEAAEDAPLHQQLRTRLT
jgi:hypothetical protein